VDAGDYGGDQLAPVLREVAGHDRDVGAAGAVRRA
jgi:hypothetical protein